MEADRKLLEAACKKKADEVTFSNGRVFNIKYDRHESIAWKDHDVCYVWPADGSFVPCGWFHIKFLVNGGS